MYMVYNELCFGGCKNYYVFLKSGWPSDSRNLINKVYRPSLMRENTRSIFLRYVHLIRALWHSKLPIVSQIFISSVFNFGESQCAWN